MLIVTHSHGKRETYRTPDQISRRVPSAALGSTGRGFVSQRSAAENRNVTASTAKTVADPLES